MKDECSQKGRRFQNPPKTPLPFVKSFLKLKKSYVVTPSILLLSVKLLYLGCLIKAFFNKEIKDKYYRMKKDMDTNSNGIRVGVTPLLKFFIKILR
jgi:hypothetical protein